MYVGIIQYIYWVKKMVIGITFPHFSLSLLVSIHKLTITTKELS